MGDTGVTGGTRLSGMITLICSVELNFSIRKNMKISVQEHMTYDEQIRELVYAD